MSPHLVCAERPRSNSRRRLFVSFRLEGRANTLRQSRHDRSTPQQPSSEHAGEDLQPLVERQYRMARSAALTGGDRHHCRGGSALVVLTDVPRDHPGDAAACAVSHTSPAPICDRRKIAAYSRLTMTARTVETICSPPFWALAVVEGIVFIVWFCAKEGVVRTSRVVTLAALYGAGGTVAARGSPNGSASRSSIVRSRVRARNARVFSRRRSQRRTTSPGATGTGLEPLTRTSPPSGASGAKVRTTRPREPYAPRRDRAIDRARRDDVRSVYGVDGEQPRALPPDDRRDLTRRRRLGQCDRGREGVAHRRSHAGPGVRP